MNGSQATKPRVTPCRSPEEPLRTGMRRVDNALYRTLVDHFDISNSQMARATGLSESYCAQVRSGTRTRVSATWLARAAEYVAVFVGDPLRVAAALVKVD